MNGLLVKCAVAGSILITIAAAPLASREFGSPAENAITNATAFSATMLEHGKSRWARERHADLADSIAKLITNAEPIDEGPTEETSGGSTNCPVEHTQCPPQLTTCPSAQTHCPVHQTVCVTTECPATETICPEELTVCRSTQCPANHTYCPSIGTLCPTIPTTCPLVATHCPVASTFCPKRDTWCPASHTHCPATITACWQQETLCWPGVCVTEGDRRPLLDGGSRIEPVATPTRARRAAPRAEFDRFGEPAHAVTFLPAAGI